MKTVTGKLAAARELSKRMKLAEISVETFGFDYTEFPAGEELGPAGIASPFRVRSPNATRGDSSSNAGVAVYEQCRTMRDLEQLTVGLDAAEVFTNALEEYNKYVY